MNDFNDLKLKTTRFRDELKRRNNFMINARVLYKFNEFEVFFTFQYGTRRKTLNLFTFATDITNLDDKILDLCTFVYFFRVQLICENELKEYFSIYNCRATRIILMN